MTIYKDQRIVHLEQELANKTAYANELSSKLHIETNKHHAVIEQRRKLEESAEKLRREHNRVRDQWAAAERARFFAMEAAQHVTMVVTYANFAISRLEELVNKRTWNAASTRKEMRRLIAEYQESQAQAIRRAGHELNVKLTTDFLIMLMKEGYTPEVQSRLDAMAEHPMDFIHVDRIYEVQKIVADKKAAQELKDKKAAEAARKQMAEEKTA
jgi:uncharacterized coiled-coil protein SlyX